MSTEEKTCWYLHVDLDAFFASVEQLDNPELRGKPVIVGGKPEDRRSVVSTASYEARAFGVHSAMPTFQAYRLCPQGIFVHGRMQRYAELSYQIMNIFRDFSPDVDQMSIDEAFIDLTGTEKLFGPPEETARKIKERVKQETGLTVSVGLASTKYLAKIASGLSKPDGFCHIKKGDEQSFMLNLPLNKVWGLGPKSLEQIKAKGLFTTRDIYEQDYDTLEFLFGKNMASFLYNVVRGIEKSSFTHEAKSHSISAETTFPYDLTDIYMIETELLELAQGVYFRLLKEESFSRTAMVKIRYDDFSTCTVQETTEQNIMTLDSFFETIKQLFEKRWDNTRGIRLLGVGFENITTEEKPYQQELFETNNKKKQAVEKAILKLSKKHPEIKVQKARTLKMIFALLVAGTLFSNPLKAEETASPEKLPEKDPPAIFEYDINDKNHIDLSLSGYWEGILSQTFAITFGKGTQTGFSIPVPVFKQNVELSALLKINNNWFFEADFADQFNKNTISAGYQGDGIIRKALLSNRGITMPEGYSASYFGFGLEGGNNQAPGFSINLQSPTDRWKADFLIRYDMTEIKSATWYGMNSVSDAKLDISNFMYGREYRFPENSQMQLREITAVYVESDSGKYTDSRNRKFRKLTNEEYALLPDKNRLLLSSTAGAQKGSLSGSRINFLPSVIITFASSSASSAIISAEGSWSDTASFLGQIQTRLGKNGKYNIEQFAYNQLTTINGETGLLIQNTRGFSPFVCAYNYDLGNTSQQQDYDVSVINRNSEKHISGFSIVNTDEIYTSTYVDLFKETHTFIQVSNIDDPASVYPFADFAPEIYLNLENNSDLCLLSRSYTPQKELRISKDAAAGSISVYKNGIIMSGTSYNNNTGVVTLGEAVSATDKIVITWQEDTKDFSKGSLTSGAGIKFNFLPEQQEDTHFTGDAILTGRWPLVFNAAYADNSSNSIKNGFAALSTGINYEYKDFKISDKTSFSVQQDNTAKGLLVINQDENVPQTYYHQISSAKEVQKDSEISGYSIPVHWTSLDEAQNLSSIMDVKLAAGNLLMNSSSLEIALKPDFRENGAVPTDQLDTHLEIYLAAGINADNPQQDFELDNYPHWRLNKDAGLDLKSNTWQKLSLSLSDLDRSRLTAYSDLRLLIRRAETSPQQDVEGTLYFGPYEPVIKACIIDAPDSYNINSRTEKYTPQIYASHIKWKDDAASITTENKDITCIKYFSPADFSSYKTITWDFSTSTGVPFVFTLDDGNSISEKTALQLEIRNTDFLNNFNFTGGALHTLTIDLKTQQVFIDGLALSSSDYSLFVNPQVVPSRQKIVLKVSDDAARYASGDFYIGRICFNEAELYCTVQNYLSAEYKKTGNILTAGTFPLLKDFEISASSLQSSGKFSKPDFSITTRAHTGVTLAGIITRADISAKQEKIDTASHSVKTDSSLIKLISAEDSYHYEITSGEIRKEDKFGLNFYDVRIPVKLELSTSVEDNKNRELQKSAVSFNYTQPVNKLSFGLSSDLKLSQKINRTNGNSKALYAERYFIDWAEATKEQFSTGHNFASTRNEHFTSKLSGVIPSAAVTFKPQLEYTLEGSYKKLTDTVFSGTEGLSLLIPFSFTDNTLGFEISRKGGEIQNISNTHLLYNHGSYIADSRETLEQQNRHQWFYNAIPFYEMFEANLAERITGAYSAKYELKYNRRLSNSFKDLYIPSAFTFSFSRDINNQTDRKADLYQIKTVLTNNSINNFGKNSSKKLFNWFEQEELFSTVTGLIKIPGKTDSSADNIKYQITAYMHLLLLIKEKTTFTTAIDFSIDNGANWSGKGTFIYERPSKTCLFSVFTDIFLPKYKDITTSIKRKETINLDYSKTADAFIQKYSYSHYAEMTIKQYLTINGEIGLMYTNNTKTADSISINLSLGAKAEF